MNRRCTDANAYKCYQPRPPHGTDFLLPRTNTWRTSCNAFYKRDRALRRTTPVSSALISLSLSLSPLREVDAGRIKEAKGLQKTSSIGPSATGDQINLSSGSVIRRPGYDTYHSPCLGSVRSHKACSSAALRLQAVAATHAGRYRWVESGGGGVEGNAAPS